MATIEWTYEDEEGVEVTVSFPAEWQICSTCRGNGSHSHGIGAITADEWANDWSLEEQEDYLAGRYDRTCEDCGGSGKVLVIDEAQARAIKPEAFAAWEKHEQDDAEYRALCRAERAAGC